MTPQVMKTSATLKTAKSMNVVAKKSVTRPAITRSMALPMPPPQTQLALEVVLKVRVLHGRDVVAPDVEEAGHVKCEAQHAVVLEALA